MLNSVVLVGRLTRDPELRYAASGAPIARFSLAVDRIGKGPSGEKQTDFIRISCFNKQAELVANYLQKGALVGIEGSLRINVVPQADGSKREYAEVTCNRVTFLSSKRETASADAEGNEFSGFGEVVATTRPAQIRDDEDDDVPFA